MKDSVRILFIFMTMMASVAWSQVLPTIVVNTGHLKQATVDRAGNIYAVSDSGIVSYNLEGEIIARNSLPNISLFDTGNGVTMLCYVKDSQQINILTPSLDIKDNFTIDKSIAISPALACMRSDYQALILDSADWSMKVIDIRDHSFVSEFTLSEVTGHYTFMKSYQGFIFLLNPQTGIEVYNRLGKKLRTLQTIDLHSFNFLGEELYYYEAGLIKYVDLYTLKTREQKITCDGCRTVLLTDQRLVKFFDAKIEFTNPPK